MAKYDDSCPCGKSELNIFSIPATLTSMDCGGYVEYNPISSIGDGTPIEFDINGSGQDYIDLATTQLYVKAKIVTADGGDIAADAVVGPVNNFLHSLFTEVDIKVNGTMVSSANNTYAYRAYLENLLSYGTDAKKSQLQASMYYKDVAGHMDNANVRGNNANNSGLVARTRWFAESKSVEMVGRIHADLFVQERYLPGDVGLQLRFVRSKPNFSLMSAAEGAAFKIIISECKLFVRKVKLMDDLLKIHGEEFQDTTAKYPLRRVVCKTFTVPAQSFDFSKEKLFTGQLPTRLVLACVDNDAYNGTFAKNPFNFKNYNLSQLKVYIDGQQHRIKPLDLNFDTDQYLHGYMSLFSGMGKMFKDEGTDIERKDFKNGYAIYAFDLTPDMSDGDHFNLIKAGSVRVDMTFRNGLPNTINVIAYAEFENVLQIDSSRNVMTDFGN